MDNEITIPNAAHWQNHSHVILRGLYTAADEAAVTNGIISVSGAGTNNVAMETRAGDQAMLKVKRMVSQGTVAVTLRTGAKYEVHLPGDVGKLLPGDLTYISAQIDAMSQPMSAEEQESFLGGQNEHAEVSLSVVR